MYLPINTINWDLLAEKFNKGKGMDVSFDGSKVYILDTSPTEIQVFIDLSVTYLNESMQTLKPLTVKANKFTLDRDPSGELKYYNTNSSTPNAPNPYSIAIGNYVLWNIVSDFIQPFVKQRSL